MKFLNDYDFKFMYHIGKANLVEDTLRRKTIEVSD